ncbi:hypothetical protein ACFYTQ_36975 [Nocardia sp. NPDC004068]
MSDDEDDITDEEIAALMAFTELDDIPRVPHTPAPRLSTREPG